jgi:nucleoside-diphosphate-sugar epimerase
MTMKELAKIIFQVGQEKGAIPKDQTLSFDHLPTYSDDVRLRVPSVEKAERLLGWKPSVATIESIRRCVDQAIAAKNAG